MSHSSTWMSGKSFKFNALLGALFIVIVGVDSIGIFTFSDIIIASEHRFLVADLLFLNTIHLVFTYVLVTFSRKFAFRMNAIKRKVIWLKPAIFLLFASSFFVFTTKNQIDLNSKISFWIALTIPAYHSLSQVMGLTIDFSNPKGPLRSKLRSLWKWGFLVFISAAILRFLDSEGIITQFFEAMCFVIFIGIFVLTMQSIGPLNRVNWISHLFSLRILLYPFVIISNLAGFAVLCLHGLEYLSVTIHQLSIDGDWKTNKNRIPFIGLLLIMVIFLTWASNVGTGAWNPVFAGTLRSCALLHYLFDGLLFRHESFYNS